MDPQDQEEHERKRDKIGHFLHDEWHKTAEKSHDSLLKGALFLEHSLGLGHKPNVIPWSEPRIDCPQRTVLIGWHPVAGMGGKWLAERSGLGKMVTKEIGKYPDPTQHWAVLVGDYVHELWMDEHLDVIYINERVDSGEEWRTFEVGKTRFSDEALRQAGEMVIHNMRLARPEYNIISNNCQNFAEKMLDAIQIGAHQEFATAFAVYQRATGKGTIKDLFVDHHPEEQKTDIGVVQGEGGEQLHRVDTVQNAQVVMDEQTTKLDNHRRFFE
ncbi:uncharacterized protein LY89DRAFT_682454 [Mollisia scopiformis]|uniref:Uncharacterized protein n=1 Tax=Mollisia scopiformis TaxID=149040 RepID=A0A194XKR9_MOLSC|nr:uncharacterized protein LY89DRAFT_682454 [Mollisia scopiformis]KUJ20773.1 hypothetical protein LY89DRAFT_682454 [Mollisia scopiformis]